MPRPLTWIEVDPLPQKIQKQRKDEANIRKQIVQTDQGHLTKEAAKDAFLGEKTQTVDRETVSNKRSTAIGRTVPPKAKNLTEANAPSKNGAREKLRELSKLGLPIIPMDQQDTGRLSRPDEPQWAEYGSMPQDYVKGVKQSDRTALNTKEYVFYGYFQRIRKRLDRAWIPILRSKLIQFYRVGRQLASDMDYSTKIVVTLNQNGEIIRVRILGESGARDLDEAAIGAFNRAGPFPNPPRGIANIKGEIDIPWEFILRT